MKDWLSYYNKEKGEEEAIGEIIEATHKSFKLQTYSSSNIPSYSSFVVVLAGEEIDIGVITAIKIEPFADLPSKPKLFKMKREELARSYKDIPEKYSAVCEAITVGYFREGEFNQTRPSNIPLIHDLVFIPTREFIRDLHIMNEKFELRYLPLIYNSLPPQEQSLFLFFLENFFENLSKYFSLEEIQMMLSSIQKSLDENYLDMLIEKVNTILIRWMEKKLPRN